MTPTFVEPDSFVADGGQTATGPAGQRAHRAALEQFDRISRRFSRIGEHAWCLVGNGLSNQTFVEGPDGLIVIDTGESVEEMAEALAEVRRVCDKPVVAVIYSHFHYVGGTTALRADPATDWNNIVIWSHKGVVPNRQRVAGELGPVASRGIAHQFGVLLPAEGQDGLLHVGLGKAFRNPAHAPFTPGFSPPTHTLEAPVKTRLAGLDVEMTPAPSDSDDSISIWFPQLRLCVNNLVWPCLFNVFPIRGEPYRDPRGLLGGIDHLRGLPIEFLLGTHGPPIVGTAAISEALTDYRDSIQFLWDQTVRGLNLGLTSAEMAHFVRLPERFERSYLTRQGYGLVEHHLRQIRNGLVGWFDGDESQLFALATGDRAARLIHGFGGRDVVRQQAREAVGKGDIRWALELASWLVRADPGTSADPGIGPASQDDKALLAGVLRCIAYGTPAQNLRNWCLTRALELEGRLDLSRFYRHRIRIEDVMAAPAAHSVALLRVMLVPEQAAGIEDELAWMFDDGSIAGLQVRGQVAVPTTGQTAALRLHLSLLTWAQVLAGKTTLAAALALGTARIEGDIERVRGILGSFDLAGLKP